MSGEEVTYTYDSLQRLITAVTTGPEWGLSFTYDGFGNRTAQSVTKGTGPASSLNIDGATNRITGFGWSYDANGNQTAMPGSGFSYDVENRLVTANGDSYGYAPSNKRVWKRKASGAEEIYFYGVGGQKLGAYIPVVSGTQLYMTAPSTNVYFGGKLIRAQNQVVGQDRLGSMRSLGIVKK